MASICCYFLSTPFQLSLSLSLSRPVLLLRRDLLIVDVVNQELAHELFRLLRIEHQRPAQHLPLGQHGVDKAAVGPCLDRLDVNGDDNKRLGLLHRGLGKDEARPRQRALGAARAIHHVDLGVGQRDKTGSEFVRRARREKVLNGKGVQALLLLGGATGRRHYCV